MVEFNNQLNNHIELAVDNEYLKGVKKGTLGFGNHTTLAVLQYLFNKFVWVTLGDKDQNDESMRKTY